MILALLLITLELQINLNNPAEIIPKTPSVSIRVYEPHELKEVVYQALPLNTFLTQHFGNDWKTADDILFTCKDGYTSVVPVERLKKHTAYLAYARKDKPDFTLYYDYEKQIINLQPFYVIWDNLKDKEVQKDGPTFWPYQVTKIEMIDFAKRYPKIIPPVKTAQITNGFNAFKKHCLACHSINGQGGQKGIELNYPKNITEYFKEDSLKYWIANPQSFRFSTNMPPLNPGLANRDQVIADIIAYLKAMRKHKQQP